MNINELLSQYAQYKMIAEQAAEQLDTIRAKIIQAIQAAGTDTITGTEHKASYKPVKQSRIDSKRLSAELPEVAKEYTCTAEYMRFTFK